MPYIAKTQRDALDPHIEKLADEIVGLSKESEAAYAGLLNYSATTLAMRILKKRFGKIRYWLIATTTGVFKNITDEFYRRAGVPYEDMMIKKQGDTKEYQDYGREMV
jgi:hypothetical protein